MKSELESAINSVEKNQTAFCKIITPNDAGATGAHQAGLYIPKDSIKLMFDTPGIIGENKEKRATIFWYDGTISECRFIYYGQGTRNEYRVTRLGKSFNVGELVILIKNTELEYSGYVINDEKEIENFLQYFQIKKENVNGLIAKNKENFSVKLTTENGFIKKIDDKSESIFFRPKAHILILLGEELIKSPVMAIYELIKNAYDADANAVDVQFEEIEDIEKARISITDTGTGINEDVLKNVWFEPGTDFRKPMNADGVRVIKRTAVFNRIPMGEKGVGRFAVHKLGNEIKLISRPAQVIIDEDGKHIQTKLLDYELTVNIDWKRFSQSKYLEDVDITWNKSFDTSTFKFKNNHGTYIEIGSLKDSWTRGMARQLKRHTLSMVSPKNNSNEFKIGLDFGNWWLDGFPEFTEIVQQAPYKATVLIDSSYNMIFEYTFELCNNEAIGSRSINDKSTILSDKQKNEKNVKGDLRPYFRNRLEQKGFDKDIVEYYIDDFLSNQMPYGSLLLEIYSFDLDAISLRDITTTPKLVRELLRDHSGIKVFKGDLRVYDYGDPGNDWLGLDLKRVQNKEWFSNNQNIGFVYLDPETSGELIEKTNREGFIQNNAYDHLVVMLTYILTEFKAERQSDRDKWLNFNRKGSTGSFEEQFSDFKNLITSVDLSSENKQKLLNEADKIEERYVQDKNSLLIPAGVGMTASYAMHEIEKLIPRMEETVNSDIYDNKKIKNQVEELKDYVEGILSVLKKGGDKPVALLDCINQAINNNASRLKSRKISVNVEEGADVSLIMGDKRIVITILMNLVDNSIYWLDTVHKDYKAIYITMYKKNNGVAILFVDNGPGFKDKIEDIVKPFFSRKEDGIGIGMYMVDTVMIQYGKLNIIYDKEYLKEKNVPDLYTGAAVELIFNKTT